MIALLVVGGIIGLVGFVMLVIGAFRSGILWGLAILLGPNVVFLLVSNLWVAEILGSIIILAFVIPRWQETRTAFILYAIGSIMVIPAFMLWGDWDEQATYAGDCEKTPRRSVCAEYEDGFVWLVSDQVSGWEKRLEGARLVQIAVGKKGRYEHPLFSSSVRFVPNDGYVAEAVESDDSEGYSWLEDKEDTVKLEFDPDLEQPSTIPPLEQRRVKTPAPPPPSMPTVDHVYVLNRTKRYYPLDCPDRPEKTYKMAKSMAIRQGYKLASECSE
ncbi:MAG: hypothetical protein KY432_06805 [Acidobacteria bacterium]|nr:hypothetical protein [Acidobacteriota bacterium]